MAQTKCAPAVRGNPNSNLLLANHLAQSAPHGSRSLDAPRLEWRFQEDQNALEEAAQGRCHNRSLPCLLQSGRHSSSLQAERLEGPGVAQRPLFSLVFQSKHLEKNVSKYGHLHGAAGEPRGNRLG